MKYCVSSYSFGVLSREDKLGYLGIIDKAAEMGFDGIEFTDGLWTENGLESAYAIRERCEKNGIEPVLLAVGADFINGQNGNSKAVVEYICKMVDFAEACGMKKLRHDVTSGFRGRKFSIGYDDALKILSPCCREVAAYAEQKGIMTCTENHGYFSQGAERVEKLINTVAHPNFGALVDIGNFLCADEDPTISVGILAPYAIHVHAKDFYFKSGSEIAPGKGWFLSRSGNYLRGTVIGYGCGKVYQSIQIIKSTGYDGYLCVEFEGGEDILTGIQTGLENLKRFVG